MVTVAQITRKFQSFAASIILRPEKVSGIRTKRAKITRSTSKFEPLNWHNVVLPAWPAVLETTKVTLLERWLGILRGQSTLPS